MNDIEKKEILEQVFNEIMKNESFKFDNFGIIDLKKIAKKYGINLCITK